MCTRDGGALFLIKLSLSLSLALAFISCCLALALISTVCLSLLPILPVMLPK